MFAYWVEGNANVHAENGFKPILYINIYITINTNAKVDANVSVSANASVKCKQTTTPKSFPEFHCAVPVYRTFRDIPSTTQETLDQQLFASPARKKINSNSIKLGSNIHTRVFFLICTEEMITIIFAILHDSFGFFTYTERGMGTVSDSKTFLNGHIILWRNIHTAQKKVQIPDPKWLL